MAKLMIVSGWIQVADDVESYQDGMTNVREILKITSPRATKAAKVCE